MGKLDGKIALITGGTTGIGAATAKLFQAEGAAVVVTGSNPQTLDAARQNLPGIEVVASDAADPGAAKALVDGVAARHGRIDVLFVNAGVVRMAPIAATDEAMFDLIFGVNVRGPYFLLKHAAPVMADGGAIVITSSISSVGSTPALSVYGASKAAIRSFGRSFANELAPRGIRVNVISPGPVDTPILGKTGMSPEALRATMEGVVARVPLNRVGQPGDIASAALFLACADSAFISGVDLFVDGGMASL